MTLPSLTRNSRFTGPAGIIARRHLPVRLAAFDPAPTCLTAAISIPASIAAPMAATCFACAMMSTEVRSLPACGSMVCRYPIARGVTSTTTMVSWAVVKLRLPCWHPPDGTSRTSVTWPRRRVRRRSASPGHFTLRADADATDKYFTRVDFTEEFPFLVSKTPYCDD